MSASFAFTFSVRDFFSLFHYFVLRLLQSCLSSARTLHALTSLSGRGKSCPQTGSRVMVAADCKA